MTTRATRAAELGLVRGFPSGPTITPPSPAGVRESPNTGTALFNTARNLATNRPATAAPTDPEAPPVVETGDMVLRNRIRLLMPWLPGPLLDIYVAAMIDTGDADLALATVRAAPTYNEFFPGNRRDDGSLRYDEQTYTSIIESFRGAVAEVGLNPDIFSGSYIEALSGNVSPNEFRSRISSAYDRIIAAAPEVQREYAEFYGINLSTEAILAAFMDPNVGQAVLERRISNAEIGGAAAQRGFDLSVAFADQLRQQGLAGGSALQFFSQAAQQLPVFQRLVDRHNDPNDTFTLEDFAAAVISNDPTESRRARRLLAQEQSLNTPLGQIARNQAGGLSGLLAR